MTVAATLVLRHRRQVQGADGVAALPRRKTGGAAVSDLNSCPVCLKAYEWVTDGPFGIGRIHAVHPVGPCVAPPPVVYALEDDEPPRRCKLCKRFFDERGSPYCSDRCADARRKYERDNAKKGNERCAICPYCEAAFWTRNPRQVTCLSDECKASHNRAVSLKWWYRCRRAA